MADNESFTRTHFAHLKLYFGLCYNRGIPEGKLDLEINKDRYMKAMNIVLDSIDKHKKENHFLREIYILGESLVEDEEQAKPIIENAVRQINGAEQYIRLYKSMHGKIDFYRMIKFSGWKESQRSNLIEKIKLIIPYTNVWHNPHGYKDRELMAIGPEEFRYHSENDIWNQFLKFNTEI